MCAGNLTHFITRIWQVIFRYVFQYLFNANRFISDDLIIEECCYTNHEKSIRSKIISLKYPHQHIPENSILIWLDPNNNECDKDFQYLSNQLRHVVNSMQTFVHVDECIDYLNNIKNEKLFIIVSDSLAEQLVSGIRDIPQLHSIYVFSRDKTTHEQWIKNYQKVKSIFAQIEPLCDMLRHDVRQADRNLAPISIVSSSAVLDLNQLDPSFMYSQLLKDILLKIEFDDIAKKNFISFCRLHQVKRNLDSKVIDEFERDYNKQSAIWWYTRDCFLYSMLNEALRTQDIEVILKMGFFIRDLHEQIKYLHSKSVNRSLLTIYRGQGMFKTEFDKMRKSVGGLLSFNNFLSTSEDQDVARIFAESARQNSKLIGVVFWMDIDSSISSTPFTALDNVGYFPDSEEEILFSMHTVFRIVKMREVENRLWKVELTRTNANDEQLKCLTDYMRVDIGTGILPEFHQLGSLMMQMGELNIAEEIYKRILTALPNNEPWVLTALHINIGHIMTLKNKQSSALPHFVKALEIQQKSFPYDYRSLSKLHNNIGDLYWSIGKYSIALSHFQKALDVRLKFLPPNHSDLATTYSNIGLIHYSMGQYSIALSYAEKTLSIRQKTLLPNHPILGISHNNVGEMHRLMGKYSSALFHLEEALEIQQKSLLSHHSDLAPSHNNIGMVRRLMGDYSAALSHHKKAVRILQKSLEPDHPDLAISINSIGEVHQSIGDYPTALLHYQNALKIRQGSLQPNHPHLATSHNNVGLVLGLMGDYAAAFSHSEKALKIREKSLPSNHPDLAMSHNNIGALYRWIGNYPAALSHHEKALEIRQESLRPDHSDIGQSHFNISSVYIAGGEFSLALSHLEQARKIWQKSLPSNHSDQAAVQSSLAVVFHRLCRYDRAVQHAREAVDIGSRTFKPDHPILMKLHQQLDEFLHE